jgi:indole-3-acetate monooxygenase
VDLLAGEPARGGPLYRLGIPAFLAYEHMAFAIGVARRALDAIVELAPSKKRGLPPTPLAERGAFQRDLAELDLRAAGRARPGAQAQPGCLGRRHRWAEAGRTHAGGLARHRGVRDQRRTGGRDAGLSLRGGGKAVCKPNVLERAVRDLHTASQHLMVSSSAYEINGKAILGATGLHPLG